MCNFMIFTRLKWSNYCLFSHILIQRSLLFNWLKNSLNNLSCAKRMRRFNFEYRSISSLSLQPFLWYTLITSTESISMKPSNDDFFRWIGQLRSTITVICWLLYLMECATIDSTLSICIATHNHHFNMIKWSNKEKNLRGKVDARLIQSDLYHAWWFVVVCTRKHTLASDQHMMDKHFHVSQFPAYSDSDSHTHLTAAKSIKCHFFKSNFKWHTVSEMNGICVN